ncbi:CDP-diacylglycerol--serine O-phosphatidyltransferase [Undibacterium fentianense]|uniref:CDP-diacylglycerol--serine O-phosphatidyltransferase n=1 Tax=Undibacterium fentianense TaxID=2828728 RepID=A0A941IDA0_9BURK|nr:CDP-diacylglycerol--serine O-phosphatidyltransferase [Undibacterium fentianense]MBR7799743.1 CDP-diacylglycerol--serine O-phosphatidyltransferase [Undibacterium fentianense]
MPLFKPKPTFNDFAAIPLGSQAIQILHSAAAFRVALLDQIANARKRIYLCSLYLQNDAAGQLILDALYTAKRNNPNVDIQIFVDWHRAQRGLIGEKTIPGKQMGNAAWYQTQSTLHQYSIPIFGVPVQTRELFGVLHLKGSVIDDTVLYTGASVNDVYLHYAEKYRYDRYWLIQQADLADCMVDWMRHHFIGSPSVHRLDQASLPTTKTIRKEIRASRDQLKKTQYVVQRNQDRADLTSLRVTPIVGMGKGNRLNRSICQLLASAKYQIVICTPYFNFPREMTREVNRALARGVKVRIIVGDKTANDFYIPPDQVFKPIACLPYLYEMNLRRFAKNHQYDITSGGLEICLWKDAEHTYHLKGVWIDQLYTLVTGNNLNPRAFRLDLENALLFTDPRGELIERRDAELAEIMVHTQTIASYKKIERLQDYPPQVKRVLQRLSRTRLDMLAYRVL